MLQENNCHATLKRLEVSRLNKYITMNPNNYNIFPKSNFLSHLCHQIVRNPRQSKNSSHTGWLLRFYGRRLLMTCFIFLRSLTFQYNRSTCVSNNIRIQMHTTKAFNVDFHILVEIISVEMVKLAPIESPLRNM